MLQFKRHINGSLHIKNVKRKSVKKIEKWEQYFFTSTFFPHFFLFGLTILQFCPKTAGKCFQNSNSQEKIPSLIMLTRRLNYVKAVPELSVPSKLLSFNYFQLSEKKNPTLVASLNAHNYNPVHLAKSVGNWGLPMRLHACMHAAVTQTKMYCALCISCSVCYYASAKYWVTLNSNLPSLSCTGCNFYWRDEVSRSIGKDLPYFLT